MELAEGRRNFARYGGRLKPWDHAAGVLMLRELGGRAQYLDDGAPYTPQATFGRPMLVAGSDAAWEAVQSVIMKR